MTVNSENIADQGTIDKYCSKYGEYAIHDKVLVDNIPVSEISVNDVMAQIKFALKSGRWFDNNINEKECILGGKIASHFNVGDKIKLQNDEYTVIGIMDSPIWFYLDYSGQNISLFDIMRNYYSLCITVDQFGSEQTLSRVVFSEKDIDTLSLKADGYILESFDEILKNTNSLYVKNLINNSFFWMLLLLELICSSCILIYSTTYFNRDVIEIFKICGASASQLIKVLVYQNVITMLIAIGGVLFLSILFGSNERGEDLFGTSLLLQIEWMCILLMIVLLVNILFALRIIVVRRWDTDDWK